MNVLTTVVSAAILSFLAVGILNNHARRTGLLDHPDHRSSHEASTPTGAGLAMILALIVITLVGFFIHRVMPLQTAALPSLWTQVCVPGALVLSVVGYLDDRKGLSARFRFAVHCTVALIFLALLMKWSGLEGWYLLPFAIVLVWTMNATNFMDGSNGMAAGQVVFASLLYAAVFAFTNAYGWAIAALSVAGVCVGFFPWNFPRARIFMGDAGSIPSGWLIGALSLAAWFAGKVPLPLILLPMAVFHVDAGLTLLARISRGEQWYTPHRRHVYQRLIAHGWKHHSVLLLYQAVNVVLVLPIFGIGMAAPELAWWLTGGLLLFLSAIWYVASLKLGEGH